MAKRPVPPADRRKKPKEGDIFCAICGVCKDQDGRGDDIPIKKCKQCSNKICRDCCNKKGNCCKCAEYDLPKNFTIVYEDDLYKTSSRVCGHTGGNLEDIPKPHRFFYDDPKMNPLVFVESHIWHGIGIHYHTSIKEDINPVWNSAENHWQEPWGISQWSVDEKFNTPKEARDFVVKTLKKRFRRKKIRVCFRSSEVRGWFYKEGD